MTSKLFLLTINYYYEDEDEYRHQNVQTKIFKRLEDAQTELSRQKACIPKIFYDKEGNINSSINIDENQNHYNLDDDFDCFNQYYYITIEEKEIF